MADPTSGWASTCARCAHCGCVCDECRTRARIEAHRCVIPSIPRGVLGQGELEAALLAARAQIDRLLSPSPIDPRAVLAALDRVRQRLQWAAAVADCIITEGSADG